MNPVKFFFALAGLSFVIFCVSPQNFALAELLSKLEHQVETVHKKDRTARSRSAVTLHPVPEEDGAFILNIEGEGQFAKFTNVRWTNSARIVERGQQVLVQHSSTKIYSENTLVFQSEKKYDYSQKIVSLTHTDKTGAAVLDEQYPIKGPICDDVTLVYLFDKIVRMDGPRRFYLLTDEPKLYHVMVKNRGTEVLRLPSGEFETTKIQLMADLGPLTDIASRMVPKTYVWLSKDNGWVQYEGMETGYQSPNIISFITVENKLE